MNGLLRSFKPYDRRNRLRVVKLQNFVTLIIIDENLRTNMTLPFEAGLRDKVAFTEEKKRKTRLYGCSICLRSRAALLTVLFVCF
jgi:hypothetical protein